MFAAMTAVRPPVWPTIQPKAPAAGNARAAFFQAAKSEAPAAPAPSPVRVDTQGQPQPQKILRPGSLLDIKV